jgi:hypothetical protein
MGKDLKRICPLRAGKEGNFMSKFVRIMSASMLLVSVLIMLNGCSGIPLKKEVVSSIHSVSINKDVAKPDHVYVYGSGETFAALAGFVTLGVVGAAIASEIPKKRGPALKYVMEKEGIDMGQIVREKFVDQLQNSGLFSTIVDEGGDAEFKLSIVHAGFAKPAGFTSKLQPELQVEGCLVKPDGSILWKKSKVVTQGTSRTPCRKFEEYINNPELISEAISISSGIVAEKLVKDMLGSSK